MEAKVVSSALKPSSGDKRKRDESEMEGNLSSKKVCGVNEKIISAYQKKEYRECLEFIADAAKVHQLTIQQKILQATCWTFLDINRSETLEVLKKIIEADAKNSFAYYGIGYRYYCDGELMESVDYLNKAIELNPTNAMQKAVELKQKATRVMEAIIDANVKFETNNVEKALKVLSSALFMDPDNEKVTENIENIRKFFLKDLVGRLESEVNVEIVESCQEIDVEKKIKKVIELVDSEQLNEAEKLIEEISELSPKNDGEFAFAKGCAFYKSGCLKLAIASLGEALTANTSHVKAQELREKAMKLNQLIDSAAEKMTEKKHLESIDLLTQAISLDETNTRIVQAAYFQRALAHFSVGKPSVAFSDFKMFESMNQSGAAISQV